MPRLAIAQTSFSENPRPVKCHRLYHLIGTGMTFNATGKKIK